MDEGNRVSGVRRRRSRAEAAELVGEYDASGLSREEFCRKHRLSLSTLARYRRRQEQAEPAGGSGWVAAEVSGGSGQEREAGSGLVLALAGGRRIEIGCGFDSQTLMRLLVALEGR